MKIFGRERLTASTIARYKPLRFPSTPALFPLMDISWQGKPPINTSHSVGTESISSHISPSTILCEKFFLYVFTALGLNSLAQIISNFVFIFFIQKEKLPQKPKSIPPQPEKREISLYFSF